MLKEQCDTRNRLGYDISVRVSWLSFDGLALALVAGLWLWKLVEFGAREVGWLERNLGWGFYVDFTIPAAATITLLLSVAFRRIARLLVR